MVGANGEDEMVCSNSAFAGRKCWLDVKNGDEAVRLPVSSGWEPDRSGQQTQDKQQPGRYPAVEPGTGYQKERPSMVCRGGLH